MIKIIQGSDKDIVLKINESATGDPYNFTGVSLISACFIKDGGGSVVKTWQQITGDVLIGTDTITNIPSTTGLTEGLPISGPGIPDGATIIKTPTSTVAPTPAGTIQISVQATATQAAATLAVGDISIISAVLGKIKIHLNEADTQSLEYGDAQSFEVKIVKNGFTSYVQFPESLNIVERYC